MLRSLTALTLALGLITAGCADDTASPEASDAPADAAGADAAGDAAFDVAEDAGDLGPCDPTPGACEGAGDDGPGRISEHAAAYDEGTLQMLVFGGSSAVPENCDPAVPAAFLADTWLWDDVCDTWTAVDGTGPSARGRHVMASGNGSAWTFGGRFRADGSTGGNYTLFPELWRFDFATRGWTEVAVTGAGPDGRTNGAMVWDTSRERLWLFGGNTSGNGGAYAPEDDVWSFDPATSTWTEHAAPGGPTPRLFHNATYDAARDRLVVYGGLDDPGFVAPPDYFTDIWALDLDALTWTQLQNEVGAPDGRFWAGLVHDTTSDTYLLFGGHDATDVGNRNDSWIFSAANDVWLRLVEGDTYNSPQIGPCDFPPDFTTVDIAQPERRSGHTLVWAETCGHALLFGGKTDCGAANDVWAYQDETWTAVATATAGEVCHRFRPNPDNCANLCF